jgi:ADP-ribose pyrophosphatase YjhB (NUDIX family)
LSTINGKVAAMNKFNEKEFLEICKKFNAEPYCEEITITYEKDNFFNKMKHSISVDRRGEVVFCVMRPNGKIITVTCSEYPEGVFRIPTGGIGHQENIIAAAYRETHEELGLDTEIVKFAGVLKIKFVYKNNYIMFIHTYLL